MSITAGRGPSPGPGYPLTEADAGHRYDVVVVGARVAGAATALHLARAGHEVLVVDRAGPPADTTSTHALMRSGVLQLQRAGVLDRIIEAGTPAIRQVDLVFGEERISFPVAHEYGVDAYYAPRRTVLDTVLLEAAVAAGAEFRTGISVTDVVRDRTGRVDGVMARAEGGRLTPVRARQVVGADGTGSRVARSVSAAVLRQHPPLNSVVYGYFDGIDAPGYEFRFVAHRNTGFVPTNDGLTLVFVGGPVAQADRDSERYLVDTLRSVAPDIAEAIAMAPRVGRLHRANGITSVLRDPAGPGWTLVGDAGFTEDPISAHGMSDALRDAEICALAVDASLRDPASEQGALDWYRRIRDHFAHPLLDTTLALASFEWDAATASQLLRGIGEVSDAATRFLLERPLVGSQTA